MNGECLCGSVRFRIQGALPNLYQCHCSLCRKATGSAAPWASSLADCSTLAGGPDSLIHLQQLLRHQNTAG